MNIYVYVYIYIYIYIVGYYSTMKRKEILSFVTVGRPRGYYAK